MHDIWLRDCKFNIPTAKNHTGEIYDEIFRNPDLKTKKIIETNWGLKAETASCNRKSNSLEWGR